MKGRTSSAEPRYSTTLAFTHESSSVRLIRVRLPSSIGPNNWKRAPGSSERRLAAASANSATPLSRSSLPMNRKVDARSWKHPRLFRRHHSKIHEQFSVFAVLEKDHRRAAKPEAIEPDHDLLQQTGTDEGGSKSAYVGHCRNA